MTPAEIAAEWSQIRKLRVVSFVEASTLLILLLIAMPLKYGFGYPLATRIMGPVHGAAFIAYVWSVIAMVSGADWPRREVAKLILAAFFPFGGFLTAGMLRRRQAIAATARKAR